MSPSRGIPTSRAYWELKAEQMLNRVFSPETPIEVEVVEAMAAPASPAELPLRQRSAHALAALLQRRPELVPIAVAGGAITAALATVAIASFWNQQQQALRQERNLVLLERLRALGPTSASQGTTANGVGDGGAPPPPPSEPWMEELAQLPANGAPPANVLQVPLSSAITQGAPAAAPSASTNNGANGDGLPQLVGVVQIPGRNGSAIFQIGGTSTNASVGESIGGSGWRLRAAAGDSATIERGGQIRRLSISSGF